MGRGWEAHRARAMHLFAPNNGVEQRILPQLQRLRATQSGSKNQNLALVFPGLAVSYPNLLGDFHPVWPCHLFLRKIWLNACHSWRVGAGREADAGTGGRMEGREQQNNEVSLPRLVGAQEWQWWLKAFEMAKTHWQTGQLSDSLYGWRYRIVKELLHSLTGTSTQPTSLPWLHSKSPDGFFTRGGAPWGFCPEWLLGLCSHRVLSKGEVPILISLWDAALPRVHTWSLLICQPADHGGCCTAAKYASWMLLLFARKENVPLNKNKYYYACVYAVEQVCRSEDNLLQLDIGIKLGSLDLHAGVFNPYVILLA